MLTTISTLLAVALGCAAGKKFRKARRLHKELTNQKGQ